MTLNEIKNAVDNGITVFYKSVSYTVIKQNDEYFIKHVYGHRIGLTWDDNTTLNGMEDDFFVEEVSDIKIPCLVINCLPVDTNIIVDHLDENGIVVDCFDTIIGEINIGLETIKNDNIHVYDIFNFLYNFNDVIDHITFKIELIQL